MSSAVNGDKPEVGLKMPRQWQEIVPTPQTPMKQNDRISVRLASLRHKQGSIAHGYGFPSIKHLFFFLGTRTSLAMPFNVADLMLILLSTHVLFATACSRIFR